MSQNVMKSEPMLFDYGPLSVQTVSVSVTGILAPVDGRAGFYLERYIFLSASSLSCRLSNAQHSPAEKTR